jgi:hypothetical protein
MNKYIRKMSVTYDTDAFCVIWNVSHKFRNKKRFFYVSWRFWIFPYFSKFNRSMNVSNSNDVTDIFLIYLFMPVVVVLEPKPSKRVGGIWWLNILTLTGMLKYDNEQRYQILHITVIFGYAIYKMAMTQL